MNEPITIIGGGLAGLTLGIGLRQHGIPVTVWEAGRYPRHRVCGEFISGQGQETLERLGLLMLLEDAGARFAKTAAFYDGRSGIPPRPLPRPALCLSRYALDEQLALELRRLGATLREGERWHGEDAPGVVHASGRRVEPVVSGYRWMGLKAHARGAAPEADIELHFLANGYVGLCRLDGETVNVCGLLRTPAPVPDLGSTWRTWLSGPEGSLLQERLAPAEFDAATFCAVAGLDTRPRAAHMQEECRIGDALTMIAPMTGNGMSMALESAELALRPLVGYSRGRSGWNEAKAEVARLFNTRFGRRLRRAAALQQLLFRPRLRKGIFHLVARSEALGNVIFRMTR